MAWANTLSSATLILYSPTHTICCAATPGSTAVDDYFLLLTHGANVYTYHLLRDGFRLRHIEEVLQRRPIVVAVWRVP